MITKNLKNNGTEKIGLVEGRIRKSGVGVGIWYILYMYFIFLIIIMYIFQIPYILDTIFYYNIVYLKLHNDDNEMV